MPCNWNKKQATTLWGHHSHRQVRGMSNELIYIHCSPAWHIYTVQLGNRCDFYVLLKQSESCLRGTHTREEMVPSFMADCFHCLCRRGQTMARRWEHGVYQGGLHAVSPPVQRVHYNNHGSLKQRVLGGLHFIKYLLYNWSLSIVVHRIM